MSDRPEVNPVPEIGFSFARLLPTLGVDVALPILAFYVLTRHGVPILWALVIGGLAPAINNLRTWIRSGRLEPLGIIVISFMVIGTATSLITGSIFWTLIRESFLTGAFGLICLGSLLTARPLMFYVNRQFVAGDDPARLEWWNGLWQYEQFRTGIRFVTVVFGVVYLIEALARVGFALVLSPAAVVTISPIMAFGVLLVLIAWNQRYMLAVRERRLREQRESQPGWPHAKLDPGPAKPT